MARDQGHTKKVTELERDGRHLIQLDRALNNGQYVGTERYVFDPSRGGALVFRELMILPVGHGDPKITSRYEVTAWRRLSDEAWIPSAWTSEYADDPPHRFTCQVERIAQFSPKDADVIFSAQDVVLHKALAHPSTGPSIQYVDLP
jgi:hypothetical protein